jgi:predicted transposase YdaD
MEMRSSDLSAIATSKREGRREGLVEGRAEGRADGIAEGRAEGKREGEEKAKKEVVIASNKAGLSIESIANITGLTPGEVLEIIKQNK